MNRTRQSAERSTDAGVEVPLGPQAADFGSNADRQLQLAQSHSEEPSILSLVDNDERHTGTGPELPEASLTKHRDQGRIDRESKMDHTARLELLRATIDRARGVLTAALGRLGGRSPDALSALGTYFGSQDEAVRKKVLTQLGDIQRRLTTEKLFPGFEEMKQSYEPTWNGFVEDGGKAKVYPGIENKVYLKPLFFRSIEDDQTRTLIHEVCHLSRGRADLSPTEYYLDAHATPADTATALNNADSYAHLAVDIFNGTVHTGWSGVG